MLLGKLPVPGRPTIWITVGQGPTALAVGAGGGLFGHFYSHLSFFSLSPSLWETAQYRLKILSQRAVKPKPTNHTLKFFCQSCFYVTDRQAIQYSCSWNFRNCCHFPLQCSKVCSLNKGCHTCMIKHTMHVQSLHCSIILPG